MSDVSPEIISKTQKSLGKYVKKPALSEKLLKKPPFRFLHDVIKAVIAETGFLDGLFTVDELNSENVKEKEAKIAFLTKLIDAIKTISKTDLKVRPSKIVAGLEPTETNVLLQTIAKSIDRKIDTKDYVAKAQAGEATGKEKNSKTTKSEKEKNKNTSSRDRAKKDSKVRDNSVARVKRTSSVETPKSTERTVESSRSNKVNDDKRKDTASKTIAKTKNIKKESSARKGDGDKVVTNNESRNNHFVDNGTTKDVQEPDPQVFIPPINKDIDEATRNPAGINEILSSVENELVENQENTSISVSKSDDKVLANFSNARQGSAGLVRPKSARPKSGDRALSSRGKGDVVMAIEVNEKDPGSIEMKAANPVIVNQRPPSALRPPSVRPSSARPGAPRLRPDSALPINESVTMGNINVIVENFDSGLGDDEDTVIIQNALEGTEDDGIQTSDLLNISGENKGQLVEQILEQIHEGNQEAGAIRKKVEIDWEQDGLRGKDATTKEVTQLRSLIQSLTKVANPLGKLMNYLHEDLDVMHNELQTWTNTKKQLYAEIEKQKKLAAESSKPLLDKTELLKHEIKKQEQEILSVRSKILSNERRIAELLGNK